MSSTLSAQSASQTVCVLVGQSIDAVTTATVLASLDQVVHLYADEEALNQTLATYNFEHQLQALWQLYITKQNIVVLPLPSDARSVFEPSGFNNARLNEKAQDATSPSLYWLFYPELPPSWTGQDDSSVVEESWINRLNASNNNQVPVILSGIAPLGVFARIAEQCQRPWVYYVPFVFLQDGRCYTSMLTPSLWLMGEKTPNSAHKLALLQPLMAGARQAYVTDITTIEFARSAIMSMLATRVSFMNEWSRLADSQGVDITQVSTIMGLDERIGKSYLKAGWGFGGQTLPAEIDALAQTYAHSQHDNPLMQAVKAINDDQKELIFRKFWQYFDGNIEDKTVSIWGASYKAGSGRTSGSAIHPLLSLLWSYNITTQVYAGEAQAELARLYPNQPLLQFIAQPEQGLDQAQALFIMAWAAHQPIPTHAINEVAVPVFDAQNLLKPSQIESLVSAYLGIGRGK